MLSAILCWTGFRPPRCSGAIKAALKQADMPVQDFDIAVAAIARAHGAEVITANLAHFNRIESLPCRHWR